MEEENKHQTSHYARLILSSISSICSLVGPLRQTLLRKSVFPWSGFSIGTRKWTGGLQPTWTDQDVGRSFLSDCTKTEERKSPQCKSGALSTNGTVTDALIYLIAVILALPSFNRPKFWEKHFEKATAAPPSTSKTERHHLKSSKFESSSRT